MSSYDPSEYLKIKYAAPTGACKCGNCQLVPPENLRQWADEIETLRKTLGYVRRFIDYELPMTGQNFVKRIDAVLAIVTAGQGGEK